MKRVPFQLGFSVFYTSAVLGFAIGYAIFG